MFLFLFYFWLFGPSINATVSTILGLLAKEIIKRNESLTFDVSLSLHEWVGGRLIFRRKEARFSITSTCIDGLPLINVQPVNWARSLMGVQVCWRNSLCSISLSYFYNIIVYSRYNYKTICAGEFSNKPSILPENFI